MAERKGRRRPPSVFVAQAEDGIAAAHFTGVIDRNGGKALVAHHVATSEEALNILRRGLEDITGTEPGSSEVVDTNGGRTFGFGNWGGSNWVPEGQMKKNWRVEPPKDPRTN